MSICRSCGADILWVEMFGSGKQMPVNVPAEKRIGLFDVDPVTGEAMPGNEVAGRVIDTYLSHFATCPQAAEHRR